MDRQQVALTASMAAAGEAYNQMAAKYDALAAEVRQLIESSTDEVLLLPSRRAYDVGEWPAIAKALKEAQEAT